MKSIFSLSLLALAFMYLAPRLQPAGTGVVDYTISGAVRLGDGSPLAGVPLALSGNQTGMAVSAADGSYSFPNLPEGFDYTVTPSAPAGSNPIEGLSVYDLLLIRRAILSIDQLSTLCQTLAADVNGTAMSPPGGPLDGVSTFDHVLIQNAMLGNNPGLTPAWEFMPLDSNYFGALGQPAFIQANNLSADLQGDILAIRAGDVSACGGAIVAIPPFLSLETAGFSGVMAGSNVSVPVTVQDFADVAGLQFSVSWDPAVLSFVSVGNFSATLGLNNSNFGEGNAANGEVRFAWFDSSVQALTLADGEVAFEITFNVVGAPGSSSLVDVNSDPLPGEVVNQAMEVSGINVQAGTVRVAGPALASISGNIRRANGTPVPGVEVNLSGNSTGQQFTDTNGNYAFPGLANGFNYTITPQWPGLCPSPCIDVYDLYLIQQHILGATPLPTPYALIAADADNSGSITVQDIIQVRSLILGNIDQFPNNTCWRFVDANYVFPDLSNPFSPPFPETADFNNLAGDVQADFIGVQVGDVSDCAEVVGASSLTLVLEADNVYCPGEPALVQVRVQGFTDVTGLQLTIRWDPAVFEYGNVLNFALPGLTAASFSQPGSSGELTMVWVSSTGIGQTLGDGSLLFNLFLNPIVSASVPATVIAFSDSPSLPVALDAAGQPGLADVQNAITAIESPELAVGPAYCYDGLQFVSFYAEGNVSASDGDNVFQGRGNNGWIVYNLMDNDAIYMQAISPAPPFCNTLYNEQAGACADALVPDCMQPIALTPDSEPGGSLQVQGNIVIWVSNEDGDPDIYAYNLATGILTNVSDNAADDQSPNLHGNRIVWRGNESGNYEIWAYDIQAQSKQQVSQNSTDEDHSPAVFGNYVAWRSNQDGDNDIYLYNLISGVETNLSDDNATGAGSPAIFGDWVVWESTDQGPDVDVFLYTISTQTKQNISDSPEDEENLVLQGDVAAWAAFDLNTFAYDLFAYRLSAGTLIPLANDVPFSLNSLAVGGDHVVWADNSDGDNEIYAYRLSDGTTLQLSNNTDEDNRPAIHAGQVVWEAFEGGEQEVRYYNLESGRTAVLGPDPADDAYPDTYGPFAVWQSDRDGNGQQEVYFFNTQLLPPPEAQLDAGASVISGLCPGDIATLVLEPAGAGLEAVWFDDEMMANELYADAANLFEPVLSGPDTFYGAWRDPLTGCIAPLTTAIADASPTDNLACLDMFSIVVEDFCQSFIDIGVLEGDLGCLQGGDFTITVQDGNPGNGPVIDGAGMYTYTVELAPGATANFSSCFGMLEALDLEPPVLTCPDDVIVQAPPGATEVAVNAPIPTWDDNCEVDPSTLMATTPFNPGNPFPIGQTPMGFSIMDVNGNVGACSYIVEVLPSAVDFNLSADTADVVAGDAFCLPFTATGFADIAGLAFTVSYDPAVVAFDMAVNFALPSINATSFDASVPGLIGFSWFDPSFLGQNLPDGTVLFELCFTALAPGVMPVTFTSGLVAIEVLNSAQDVVPFNSDPGLVTVTAPLALDCPADVVQANDPGQCGALVDIPAPPLPAPGVLVNDFTGNDDASGVYPVGITNVQYTFFGADDTLTCSFTVEVTDAEPPVIDCPADISVQATSAQGATADWPAPQPTDNCGVDNLSPNFNPGDLFPLGQTAVMYTAADLAGNASECSFTVEVLPPPADLTLSVGSATVAEGETFCLPVTVEGFQDLVGMQFSITYDAAVVEFTQVTSFGLPGLGAQNFGFVAPGILSFSWNDNDFSGESLPDGTVLFELCFTALAPGATTVEIGGQPAVIEAVNTASEVVPVTVNPGTITVTAPLVLDCPPDVGQASDPGLCEAFVDILVPALPAPGVLVNNYTGSDDASGVYPVGVTDVEYTFFGADDTLVCSFTVEVTDTEAPVAGCPATLQVTGDAAAGGATVTLPGPTVSDNCPMAAWVYAPASGEFFPCGATTVTCTATDMSGNQSECTFTVAVNCSPDTCCLNFNGVTIVDPINLTGGLADTGFDFIDADNDGDQDILAYNTLGVLEVIRNQPPYDPPNFELMAPIPIGFNAISPSTLDYNQDGFEDFFAIELGSNEVIYYENQGNIGVPSFNAIPTGLALPLEATAIAVGDLGNDGIADLLVHTSGAGIAGVYYEGGCQAPAVPCFTLAGNDYANPFINLPGAPVTSANAFELFDGDCDGDLDIFIADGAALAPNPEVWCFENYGGLAPSGSLPDVENVNYLTNPFGLTGWTSSSNAVLLRLADVDNDQLAEAFLDAGSMSYFDNFCPPPAAACCADSLAFVDLVAQGFTVAVSDNCGVTVTAQQFDSCHWFSTPPDWGDGSGTLQVVEPANGTWMHTYSQSGTYDICVTVFEADTPGSPPCWSAQMCTTVAVDCACPDLSLIPTPSAPDSSLVGCCWNLDYSNTGSDSVYGIRLTPLDGMELSVHNEGPEFMVSSTINGALIVPTGFGLMPPSAPTLADICLSHVLATPQYVVVQYMDENYVPFCFDTLVFNCPVEETCLYIVSDSLTCDTNGYKYVATVTNPSGADFPVKYVKLNITSGPPGLTLLPQAGIVLPDTLYQGDTTMVMWNFPTDEDWFGDTLCFILSAHDGPEERLCCAEIDTCITFPSCDPCLYKDTEVAISPLPGTGGGGDCLEGDPLEEPWLQELIAGCAERPCGMLVYCCLFQGQPVVNVQDDDTACTDAGGTVYDYMGNQLFFYGGIGGINLDLYDQLEDCTLIFECAQLGDCCYSLLVSNNHPAPGFFTGIHTNILTPGITFSALNFGLGAGWSFDPPLAGQSAYTWSHNSGGIPVLDSYNLFDFCVEGAATTDSISIEVQWLRSDSILCRDTVKVYCPECVVITQEDILCDSSGVYTYTFSGQNWSDYDVNAVGFVEVSPGFEILENVVPLPSPAPPDGGAFGPLPITIVDSTGMAGDTLCFDIVLRQVVGDSINILCCYARHCIVLPPCNNGEPCPDIFCQAPADITTACSALPAFDPNDPGDLQGLFGTASAGGNCPGATWQELPPVVNLADCSGGTIVRTFQAFDGAGNASANPCTQTVTLQGGETNYSIRFPADADVDCAGLDTVSPEVFGGSCDLIGITFTEQEIIPSATGCRQLARTWRVVNFCEYDGTAAPVTVSRDEDCDGQEGEEDIWVLVRPGLSYLDQNSDENNALPAAGIRGAACDGLSNPAGYWVDSGIKPAIASVGAWEYTQLITLTEDCLPPTGLVCNSSLSAEIQPLAIPADVDGDGDIDDAAVTLSPDGFIISPAVDDCSPPVAYSINLEGQAPDPGQSSISLTCDNLGPVNLEIHAWDAAGNQDFCPLVVTVEDPQGLCGNLAAREAVRLQPNPATDELLVRSRRQGACRMDILGADGPVRRSREVRFRGPAERLSLEGLPPGLYLLRLHYADGHTVVRRFVKM